MSRRLLCLLLIGVAGLASAQPTKLDAAFRAALIVEAESSTSSTIGVGMIVDSLGGVLTALHGVERADSISVRRPGAKSWRAELVAADPVRDLAFLRVLAPAPLAEPLRPAPLPPMGSPIFVLGNPLGTGLVLTAGILAAHPDPSAEPGAPEGHVLLDALVVPGTSGGPVLSPNGDWLGVVVGKAVVQGQIIDLGMAIPALDAELFARESRRRGEHPPPWIGVTVETMTGSMAKALGTPFTAGVVVSRVVSGSPGNWAGLSPMDVITAMDGRQVHGADEFNRLVANRIPGEALELSVSTDGHGRILSVDLIKAPAETETRPQLAEVVELEDAGLAIAELSGAPPTVMVIAVVPNGPAARAGLRPGDLIDLVGRQPATSSLLQGAVGLQAPLLRPIILRLRRGDKSTLATIAWE